MNLGAKVMKLSETDKDVATKKSYFFKKWYRRFLIVTV